MQESGAAPQEGPNTLLLQGVSQPLTAESLEQKLHGFDRDPGREWARVTMWEPLGVGSVPCWAMGLRALQTAVAGRMGEGGSEVSFQEEMPKAPRWRRLLESTDV